MGRVCSARAAAIAVKCCKAASAPTRHACRLPPPLSWQPHRVLLPLHPWPPPAAARRTRGLEEALVQRVAHQLPPQLRQAVARGQQLLEGGRQLGAAAHGAKARAARQHRHHALRSAGGREEPAGSHAATKRRVAGAPPGCTVLQPGPPVPASAASAPGEARGPPSRTRRPPACRSSPGSVSVPVLSKHSTSRWPASATAEGLDTKMSCVWRGGGGARWYEASPAQGARRPVRAGARMACRRVHMHAMPLRHRRCPRNRAPPSSSSAAPGSRAPAGAPPRWRWPR